MIALIMQTAGGDKNLSENGVAVMDSAFPKTCPGLVLSVRLYVY